MISSPAACKRATGSDSFSYFTGFGDFPDRETDSDDVDLKL